MNQTSQSCTAPDDSVLRVLSVMAEADRLAKKAARKPRVAEVRYVLLMWDADGNGYGTGRALCTSIAQADRLIRDFKTTGPASAALWTADEERLVKSYENLVRK